MRLLFAAAIFLAAFLLFLLEPMAAKQLLPIFGGSSAVWITCLVFFQSALLAGYAYAHWQTQRSGPTSRRMHLGLLAAATTVAGVFAFHHPAPGATTTDPALAIFAALGLFIGLPFLALSSSTPLLQFWLACVDAGRVPYWLFALSNFASLLALGLYPTLIEPYLSLQQQRIGWALGFAVFALLFAFLTWKTRGATLPSSSPARDESGLPPTPLSHKLLWLLLPMGAAMQLSAVTSYLTANIAAIPLLWILPLAVYLITLILAFQFPQLAHRWLVMRLMAVMLACLGYVLTKVDQSLPVRNGILFFLLELFIACLFCHTEAYDLRPKRPSESTLFYLLFAAGGALGSFFIGIAAPMLFRFNYDLALAFLVTALLALAVAWPSGWGPRLLWVTASGGMLVLVAFMQIAYQRDTPVAVRNFYGSLRVKQSLGYPGAVIRTLSNGNIQHGTQIFSTELAHTPTTYYAPDSGVGLALNQCCTGPESVPRPRHVGVIGLGAGTLAAYARAGDQLRFYEINPAVAPIAHNLFTYMRDATQAGASISVVEGDARTSLATEPPQNFDILVVDAFSGDAIPLHLLTAEALEIYKKHLAPAGILAIHISNQHVDLEPVVTRLADSAGMQAMRVSSPINESRGEFSATWMLLSADNRFFTIPEVFNHASKPRRNDALRLWTDDYSSLMPVIRW